MASGGTCPARWLLPVVAMWMVRSAAAVPVDLLGSSGVREEVCDALRGRQMVEQTFARCALEMLFR